MPTYTYACTQCADTIERRQSFSDAPLTTCQECGGALRKVFHPVGIVFKGSGWYVNDSRSKSSTADPSEPVSAEVPTKDGKNGAGNPADTSKEAAPAPAAAPAATATPAKPAEKSKKAESSTKEA